MRSQDRPCVVVRPRILGVRVLGEDDELAHIVGPVAKGVKVKRAPQRLRRRGRLHAREGVAVAYTPPAVHVGLRRSELERDRTPESRQEARKALSQEPNGHANRPARHGADGDVDDQVQPVPRPTTPGPRGYVSSSGTAEASRLKGLCERLAPTPKPAGQGRRGAVERHEHLEIEPVGGQSRPMGWIRKRGGRS